MAAGFLGLGVRGHQVQGLAAGWAGSRSTSDSYTPGERSGCWWPRDRLHHTQVAWVLGIQAWTVAALQPEALRGLRLAGVHVSSPLEGAGRCCDLAPGPVACPGARLCSLPQALLFLGCGQLLRWPSSLLLTDTPATWWCPGPKASGGGAAQGSLCPWPPPSLTQGYSGVLE